MKQLNEYVEHTLLKQDATKEEFLKLFEEAKEHKFLGVCVNPAYVKLAKENLAGSDVISSVHLMQALQLIAKLLHLKRKKQLAMALMKLIWL